MSETQTIQTPTVETTTTYTYIVSPLQHIAVHGNPYGIILDQVTVTVATYPDGEVLISDSYYGTDCKANGTVDGRATRHGYHLPTDTAFRDQYTADACRRAGLDTHDTPPAPPATMVDIDVTPPDPEFDITTWNVVGDLRVTDDDEANYDAAADLRPRNRVQFDSEMSCFYAYCQTEADAVLLIHDLRTWVDTRRGA